MFNWMRTHQRKLWLVITILTIVSFIVLYNSSQLENLRSDSFARVYGKNLSITDFQRQGRKFMAAVKLGVISLNHDDGLAPIIKLLGIRYRQMGLKVRDYRTMTKALLWTFERSLEDKFTPKTKDAWNVLLTQVTRLLSGSDAALLRSV